MNKLLHGDCLELMRDIPSESIDMILCDLPYEQTSNTWDIMIPFEPLWEQYKRIIKDNGVIVLTAKSNFMFDLVNSNRDMFRYELVWNKKKAANFAHANKRPLISHEYLLIFYKKLPTYNPQKTQGKPYRQLRHRDSVKGIADNMKDIYITENKNGLRYPKSIIEVENHAQRDSMHPTQKPVALFEYLIKTYTNEGETVLDNCAGSGTTAIAALNTNRKFICMEKDAEYFKIMRKRVLERQTELADI